MKALFSISLLLTLSASAQDVSGLYAGTLSNDTTGLIQQYELSLQQEGNRVGGYSYTTFVLNDRFHFGFRKVKGTVKEGKLYVEESDILDNNFPSPPPKGIRRLSVFPLGTGTVEILEGGWASNPTRRWASVTGNIRLRRRTDSSGSALVARVRELQVPVDKAAEPSVRRPAATVALAAPAPSVRAFSERAATTLQTIAVSGDSLTLHFYDNGIVDGDSVSLYLDGRPLLQKIGLRAEAFRHSFRIPSGTRFELLLVADNLGSLPPNTGLLVVQAGSRRHHVYFSADLKTNARIILQRQDGTN